MGVIARLAATAEAAVPLPACHLLAWPSSRLGGVHAPLGHTRRITVKIPSRRRWPPPDPVSPPAATAHGTAMS